MGAHEERIRVVCHLPVNNDDQEFVIFQFLKMLRELKDVEGAEIGGFTMSRVESPVFFGYWWSEDQQKWVKDKLVLCYIDYRADPTIRPVSQVVRELKENIENLYLVHAKAEEEIWIVAHPVVRQQ
jgi:hypothetical protein